MPTPAPPAVPADPADATPDATADEARRLARLRELFVLDSPAEPVFDAIARLASQVCGTPIALMSLVDEERQWFKANVGLAGVNETPRDVAFCAHAIEGDAVLEVPDATQDPRFATNPLVTGQPDIRFYAGAPMVVPTGERIGTLCVIDREPRQLDAAQTQLLRALAEIATGALTMRRDLIDRSLSVRSEHERSLRDNQTFLSRTGRVAGVGGWEITLADSKVNWSPETRQIHEVPADYTPSLATAISFYAPEAQPVIQQAVERGLAHGEPWDLELPFITATGRRTWVRAMGEVEFEGGKPVRMAGAFQDIGERKLLEQRVARSERFMRQITDSLPVGIGYLDTEQRFQFANQALCERFGRKHDDIIGRTRAELTGGVDDAPLAPKVAAAFAGHAQRFEADELMGDVCRRVELRLIPDIDDTGQVRGLFTTGEDITERAAAERNLRLLTTIFDNTSDWVVQTDWRGRIIYMNPAVRQAVGIAPDEDVSQRLVSEFNTPETNQQFDAQILPTAKAQGVWLGETTVRVADQRVVPISHMVIAHRDGNGRVERYSSVMRDISAQARAKQQAQRQTATLRSITESIPASIAVVDADARYRFVNSGFERWLGQSRDETIGRKVSDVLGTAEFEQRLPWVKRALAGETVHFEHDERGRGRSAHLAISYVPLRLDDGSVDGFVAMTQDITERKREEARLLQMTHRDALTGALNRSGFEHYLQAQVDAGTAASLALLYIDLDRFKPVNDQHGHAVGDLVLQIFTQRLQHLVRPTDAVARLGGDEFAVALAGVRESANASAVAEKVVAAANTPFGCGPLEVHIGASVGMAYGTDAATGWAELLARADAMMYRVKEASRGEPHATER